jgi:hypothetical protein
VEKRKLLGMRYFNRANRTVKDNKTGLPCWQKCKDKTFWRNGPGICQCNFTATCVKKSENDQVTAGLGNVSKRG